MGLEVLLVLVNCIIFGGLANYLGNKKNIDNAFWWGFLLGVIGLIIVAGLPTQEEKVEKTVEKAVENNVEEESDNKAALIFFCIVMFVACLVAGRIIFYL
mgnify:CR=1 FL=1